MGLNLPLDLQSIDPGLRLGDVGELANAILYAGGMSTQNAITASTTQSQIGGTKIYFAINRVTSANGNDAITLGFTADAGRSFVIINDSGQTITMYPKSGDKINDAAKDAAVSLADNTVSTYYSPLIGLWFGGAVTLET